MLELFQITNDAAFAQRCDDLGGFRLFVDLERMGKAERQAGRNTFISAHLLLDVGRSEEVEAVLGEGADMLMLPMFRTADDVRTFIDIVGGRAPVVTLLETADALACIDSWVATPGLAEVFVGLNDLHLSLGCRFMFEPLARGLVDRVAGSAKAHGLRFGFGGIARLDEGQLPGRDVLAEHLRLGSGAVILSRTFHRPGEGGSFEEEVAKLRAAEALLARRAPAEIEADRVRIAAIIDTIAAGMGAAR
ncbi:aldolase [Caenimonas koreensis]|uniref:aldolase n=1 Tax=Caenimonas koreensis TaxID=367474 RepID=UPI0037845D59